ncbi:hypothetical protein EVAR_43921_1 [Eumeta japonica]|uniref:Uncharacterized protein n=1 Tax=Eumeta variegata TaxID=151549 RepID=A0A4C1WPD9_EUMVA|nr:hypothetical protein EVAR_43921_1 [Eumeta japonica]
MDFHVELTSFYTFIEIFMKRLSQCNRSRSNRAFEPLKSKWSPEPIGTRSLKGVTKALLASSVGMGYLMKKKVGVMVGYEAANRGRWGHDSSWARPAALISVFELSRLDLDYVTPTARRLYPLLALPTIILNAVALVSDSSIALILSSVAAVEGDPLPRPSVRLV